MQSEMRQLVDTVARGISESGVEIPREKTRELAAMLTAEVVAEVSAETSFRVLADVMTKE